MSSSKTSQSTTNHGESKRATRSQNATEKPVSRPRKLGQLKLEDAKIGIMGAGKIADALVQGFVNYGKIPANRIHVTAPSSKNLENFKTMGCHISKRNIDLFGRFDCDIIFICVHGSVVRRCFKMGGTRPAALCTNYIPYMRHPLYVISLVSGCTVKQIRQTLINPDHPEKYVIEAHRVMVNTAAMYGLALIAVDCEPDSKKLSPCVRQLLSSVGKLEHVPESQMDAACAIGGSGLAFSYFFIGALSDGAFKMGLSRPMALRFAAKTLQCAAQTQLETGRHPSELKDDVCSPSGAAVYGVHVLNKADVASGISGAIEAAHKRASELAEA
jgi:pyrroline-5-carboxylate reductase